jgi:glycosyltransferase involved in cell wall biosynthesis
LAQQDRDQGECSGDAQGEATPLPARRVLRVAMWTPLPPAASGIADYSAELLPALSAHADLTLYTNPDADASAFAHLPVAMRSYYDYAGDQHRGSLPAPDVHLYHMGNNARFHEEIYHHLRRTPGVVVLHDLALFGFHLYGLYHRGRRREFWDEVAYQHGAAGGQNVAKYINGELSTWLDLPMNRRVVEASLATIVHTPFGQRYLQERYPGAAVHYVMPGAQLFDELSNAAVRSALGWSDDPFVVGVFGEINVHKRVHVMLDALTAVRAALPTLRVVIVGREAEHPAYPSKIRATIRQRKLTEVVTYAADVPLVDLERYIRAVDVVVNLRWPTSGEISGILPRALAAGKPVICSDVASNRDLPEAFCWRIPVGEGEVEALTARLIAAAQNRKSTRRAGDEARRYMAAHGAWPIVAKRYAATLAAVMDGSHHHAAE